MTITLAPDDPVDRREESLHPDLHWRRKLRRVLKEREPKPSIVYRITEFYFSRRWPAAALVVTALGLISLAFFYVATEAGR